MADAGREVSKKEKGLIRFVSLSKSKTRSGHDPRTSFSGRVFRRFSRPFGMDSEEMDKRTSKAFVVTVRKSIEKGKFREGVVHRSSKMMLRSKYVKRPIWELGLPLQRQMKRFSPTLDAKSQERFHELVDKKLIGTISDDERAELSRLEFGLRELETQDSEAQAFQKDWSRRLDGAIGALQDINRKLEMLLSSGK